GSGAAEVAYRLRLQSFAAAELLPRFAPPTEAEVTALSRDLAAHFKSRDLKNLVPRSPEGLERQDLAFALWRTSPLPPPPGPPPRRWASTPPPGPPRPSPSACPSRRTARSTSARCAWPRAGRPSGSRRSSPGNRS